MKWTATQETTLLQALEKLAPDSSKTTLRSWIKEGRVCVDEETVTLSSLVVRPGQLITLGSKPRFASQMRILYEDRHLVVVDKPTGLLAVSTAFEKGETAHAILKDKYRPGRVYVVHRIDQDTSGVMMFARSEKVQDKLKDLLEVHDIERVYYALVEGTLKEKSGTWESYQFEDGNYLVHNSEDLTKGKKAVTHYIVKKIFKRGSLLELRLETGRKNQIRAHCQWAGHSVVGDKKYGAKGNPYKRLCLHAYQLGFVHPMTGKKMVFNSPLPDFCEAS